MPPKVSNSTSRNALRYLLKEAKKAGITLSNVFVERNPRRPPNRQYVKRIYKGRFVKKKLPPSSKHALEPQPTVPKLPPLGPQTVPQPLKPPPPSSTHSPPSSGSPTGGGGGGKGPLLSSDGSAATTSSGGSSSSSTTTIFNQVYNWWKRNAAVLVLNFGSLCTLTGFTRSDVLELRAFSMTGSLASVLYFIWTPPLKLTPIVWSSIFAAVNGFKIYSILSERHSKVVLSEEEQDIFVEHFMPSGVTPKQFQLVMNKASVQTYKKGDVIVQQGEPLTNIYLVTDGKTRAHYMGRRLTAISSAPGKKEEKMGGDAGAWIGEMTFLEQYGKRTTTSTTTNSTTASSKSNGSSSKNVESSSSTSKKQAAGLTGKAIYTIVAASDCKVLVWSHTNVEDLLQSSTDLRASMTRAMTAPIVGKVINFTVSMGSKSRGGGGVLLPWTTWLEDWKNSGENTRVQVEQVSTDDENSEQQQPMEPIM